MLIYASMKSTQITILILLFLSLYIQVPVLAIGNPDIEILSFETAPSAVSGGKLYVEYTVTNSGNFTSGPLKLTYYLSRENTLSSKKIMVREVRIKFLLPGETRTAYESISIPSSVQPGTFYPIIEIIPAQSALKDSNQENNLLIAAQIEITSQNTLSREWINKKASELLFLKTNEERELRNRAPLTYNRVLAATAQGHANDMAKHDYFDHVSLDGKTPHDRAVDQGYPYERTRKNGIIYGIGENIVRFPTGNKMYVKRFGYIDPTDPIQLANAALISFMESASHRKTLLDDIYTEIGVAAAMGQDGYYYLAQNFG